MKYKYNKKAIQIQRIEDDGTTLLILRDTQNRLVINNSGRNLLSLISNYCDDYYFILRRSRAKRAQRRKSLPR